MRLSRRVDWRVLGAAKRGQATSGPAAPLHLSVRYDQTRTDALRLIEVAVRCAGRSEPSAKAQNRSKAPAIDGPMPSSGGGGGQFACFPMIIAGTPLGVLGVDAEPPLNDQQRRMLTAAAALSTLFMPSVKL